MRDTHRYGLVVLLVVVMFTFGQAAPEGDVTRMVFVGLAGGTLVLACWSSGVRRWIAWTAIGVSVFAFVAAVVATFGIADSTVGGVTLISALLSVVAPAVIAHGVITDIQEKGRVTLQSVTGALAVYLLIGMLFAFLYDCIAAFQDTPFFGASGNGNIQEYLYFSYVTLTTTGYGDLSAATGLGRSLAVLEAVLGQLYLVTIVAVVVSNLKPRRAPGPAAGDPSQPPEPPAAR